MLTSPPARRAAGFTLIELAIALVVIGLVVGGVLVGRDMVEAAGLRRVASEVERYTAAVQTFRLKYNAVPGDMPNATAFWGAMANCTNWVPDTPAVPTCNGNGRVEDRDGTTGSFAVRETYLFWQHLSNSGLIAGAYRGGNTNPVIRPAIGATIPPAGYRAAGVIVEEYAATGGHRFDVGAAFDCAANEVDDTGGILTPAEMAAFDQKLDDGLPRVGRLQNATRTGYGSGTPDSGLNHCATCFACTMGTYKMSNADPSHRVCSPRFLVGF